MEAMIERVGGARASKKGDRAFRTVTQELLEMREWFIAKGVTHVAIEGIAVYWRTGYGLLEDAFEMVLGNVHHIKNVPGRKTDVKGSEGLAELARQGLIAKCFVPRRSRRSGCGICSATGGG